MDLFGRYHEKKLEIITEKSKIEWHFDNTDLKSNNIKIFSGKRSLQSSQESTREAPKILSAGKVERNAMYLRQIKHFFHCIKNKKQIRGDVACLKDGFHTMNVIQAARRSARCGSKVEVLQNAF
jgi:predicted dehydrogenase